MENKLIDSFSRAFSIELPYRDTLDEYLYEILPVVQKWGEDLYEEQYYVMDGGKPWLEIRDDDNFSETVLHFFNEGGEYLQSVNGNVSRGKWRLLDSTNKMMISHGHSKGEMTELYELAYLNAYFFILRKHGSSRNKFFVMGYEPAVAGLTWRDYVELLFNQYRSKSIFYRNIIIAVIVLVIVAVLFSIF